MPPYKHNLENLAMVPNQSYRGPVVLAVLPQDYAPEKNYDMTVGETSAWMLGLGLLFGLVCFPLGIAYAAAGAGAGLIAGAMVGGYSEMSSAVSKTNDSSVKAFCEEVYAYACEAEALDVEKAPHVVRRIAELAASNSSLYRRAVKALAANEETYAMAEGIEKIVEDETAKSSKEKSPGKNQNNQYAFADVSDKTTEGYQTESNGQDPQSTDSDKEGGPKRTSAAGSDNPDIGETDAESDGDDSGNE